MQGMREYNKLRLGADPVCIKAAIPGAGDDEHQFTHLDAVEADAKGDGSIAGNL